jgi:NitT/TauT family transport system ATP-binding protein
VLEQVSKHFPRRNIHALDRVDLTMREGRFYSIIGSSGCGKSTLLKIMAGLQPPSSGSVMLEGKPVLGPRSDIGMMFQQATLLPWRTTLENVVLPIEIRDGKAAALAAHDKGPTAFEARRIEWIRIGLSLRALGWYGAASCHMQNADFRTIGFVVGRAVQCFR